MASNTDSKLSKIADKWERMKKDKVESNPIDITNFIPNLYDMIREDCVIDVLKDIANDLNDSDNYEDAAYYIEEPFSTTPGYYAKEKLMILRASNIKRDSAEWELNLIDGDTCSFNLDDLHIGEKGNESFKIGDDEYRDFKDYVQKTNLVSFSNDEKELGFIERNSIILKAIGINAPEIPHYDAVVIEDIATSVKAFTYKEVKEKSIEKNSEFCYFPYTINKNKSENYEKWSVSERDENERIVFYKTKNGSKTTYYEIRNDIKLEKYFEEGELQHLPKNATVRVICNSKSNWGSETVIDGFRAQARVKELLGNDSKIADILVMMDASSLAVNNISYNYSPYSSLWYITDTFSHIIKTWENNLNVSLRKLSYVPMGVDKYGNYLGTIYVKLKTPEGYSWINLSKYVLAGTNTTTPNPDFEDSPELKKIKDSANYDAFNLGTYSRLNNVYLDNIDVNGEESFNEMVELHKTLTGIDIKTKNECTMMLGDSLFLIPPQSIRNISHAEYTKVPVLRGKGTMTKNQANREQLLEIDLFFYGENGINGIPYEASFPNNAKATYYMNGLRALYAQFKTCPFLPIQNYYINNILGIEVVSMVNIVVNTVEGFPKLLKATLTLRDFNYRVYMPDLPLPTIDDYTGNIKEFEPVFAKCFEWKLFRYYYQRAIIHGEKIADRQYNSYQYGEYFYSYKNVLQRANLGSQSIEFFIPDEKWLVNALKIKKEKDKGGAIAPGVYDDQPDIVEIRNNNTPNFNDSDKNTNSFERYGTLDHLGRCTSCYANIGKDLMPTKDREDLYVNPTGYVQKNYDFIPNGGWLYNRCHLIGFQLTGENNNEKNLITGTWYTNNENGMVTYENKVAKYIKDTGNHVLYRVTPVFEGSNLVASGVIMEAESVEDKGKGIKFNVYIKNVQPRVKINYATGESEEDNKQDYGGFNFANYQDPKAMAFVPYLVDEDNNSIPIQLNDLAISTSNTFTEMYLKATDGYAPQFMGGADVNIEFKILTTDELVVALLNQLPAFVIQTTKTYRRVLPCCPLRVKNDYLQMFGVNEVLIDNIDINTVDGFPGLYDIRIKMTSVDRTMRQQEALRKLNTDGFTTDIGESAIKGYFSLDKGLAQAELYPDLDLPTLSELEDKGWQYLKYKNENRVFVDPDFYIVYSFKYTALLFKEIIKEYMYKKFYNDDTENNNTSSSKAFDLYLQDDSGMKLGAMLNNTIGLNCLNDNKLAEMYDDEIEKISVQSETDGISKTLFKSEKFEDIMEIGISLNSLTAYGIENGWQIKPGWYASLPEEYINDLVEKLDESKVKRANVKEEDKKNEWIKDLYNIRKEAISLIDDILAEPMTFKNSSTKEGYKDEVLKYAVGNVFDNPKGHKLLSLLDPMHGCFARYDSFIPNNELRLATIPLGEKKEMGDDINEDGKIYDIPNLLNYIQAYTFASGCALSGAESYTKNATKGNWFPKQYINIDKDIPNVKSKNNETISGSLPNSSTKKIAEEKGRFFGAHQLGIYPVERIRGFMSTTSKVDYGSKNMYPNSVKKHNRFCEEGFVDPYYNFAGYKSTASKKYIKEITNSAYDNAVAYLRIMLLHLKRMIIDGLFFSEIDIIAKDYEYVKSEWYKTLENDQKVKDDWANSGDDSHGDHKEVLDNLRSNQVEKEFGLNIEEVTELLEVTIPESYGKIFCARMIYPFLSAMSENNDEIKKLVERRDYESLNLMTLGSNVGCADYRVLDKFLKSLYAIRLIGYAKDVDSSTTTSNSQKIFNSIMQEVVSTYSDNPKKYVLHSFYDMIKNDKRGRLIRAFPTYYIVFVDEGRRIGTWKLYDNFYNMSSVNNIQVVKSRKIPVDTCSFTMTNLYLSYAETYDNTTYQQYVDVYGVKDYYNSIFSPREYVDKEDAVRARKELADTTVLKAGTRIHLRMGYGSNAAKLPIVFNGKVAEVDCGEVVQVVCQGDGHELMNPLNTLGEFEAKSLEEAQSWITILKDIRGTLARGGESPKNLLAKLMTAKYGGLIKNIIRDEFDERFFGDNPFGVYHFGDRRFKDIFEASEIVQNIYEVTNETLLSGYTTIIPDKTETCASPTINCTIQDKTMWDIMHMCANAGDDYYAAVRDFGMRSTVCLCKPNQYYAYEYFEDQNKYFEKRKPFQQYHYYDSYNDIVYNTIKASEKNMKTNAVGTWESTDYIWGTSQSTVGPIYLDMNIYPEYQKSMTVDTGLIASGNGGAKLNFLTAVSEKWNYDANDDKVNKSLAEKMTTNTLKNNVKDMYEGELCVIGDPSVKPLDRMDIVDTYEDMSGSVEVETVIYSMNSDTGFTTTIIPDIITKAVDCSQEIANQTILGEFVLASGALVTGRLAMKKIMQTSGADIAAKIASSSKVTNLATSLKLAKDELGVIKLISASMNPVGIMGTIVGAACVYAFVRNTKELLYRWMKNVQAVTVYPIQKNQRPLIAGMAGHRGSVYGYQYSNPKDSIQGMVMGLLETGGDIPLAGLLVDTFFTGDEYDAIYSYWKESLGINKVDNDVLSQSDYNLVTENLLQDIYNSVSMELSARAASIQSLKTKIRLTKFNTNNLTDKTYLKYQIGGIYKAAKEAIKDKDGEQYKAYSKLAPEETRYVTIDELGKNSKIQALVPVEDDPDIKLAKSGGHEIIGSFKFAHSESILTFDCQFENGNKEIRYLVDGENDNAIFDLPMIQNDALLVLKIILNDDGLKGAEIFFLSGARINDTRSWKSTGFAFAISCNDNKALLDAVKNAKADTCWYGSGDKKKNSIFNYSTYDNGIMITVYPSKENI